jgi:hypothetical protein
MKSAAICMKRCCLHEAVTHCVLGEPPVLCAVQWQGHLRITRMLRMRSAKLQPRADQFPWMVNFTAIFSIFASAE